MTTTQLVDRVMDFYDQVPSTDADATNRRSRILNALRELSDEVWHYRDWSFKRTADQITYAAGGDSTNLPQNFDHFDENAGVFLNGVLLEEVPVQRIATLLEQNYQNTVNPPYSVIWRDIVAERASIQLPTMPSAVTLSIYYMLTPPAFDAEIDNDMVSYPSQYHNTVLLAGTVAKMKRIKGDTLEWRRRYEEGLAYMVAKEVARQPMVQRMPRAIISAW